MKLPQAETGIATLLNTFTLTGISLLWGHMLGLINPWFMPLTIMCIIVGYGSEIRNKNGR
jgi:hypothetical protein